MATPPRFSATRLPGKRALDLPLVALQRAHAARRPVGEKIDRIAHGKKAIAEGAGHDRAEARQAEDAVDGQAGAAAIAAGRQRRQPAGQRSAQIIQPGAGFRTHAHDRRAFQTSADQDILNVQLDQIQPFGFIYQIDFCQGDQTIGEGKQVQDSKMFPGLGHDSLVGGDDEEGGVDTPDTGQHVLDKVDVAGHINNADRFLRTVGHRQIHPGEAQHDRQPAAFLLFQTVRVNSAQGLNQRRLAVVHMPGCGDDSHQARFCVGSPDTILAVRWVLLFWRA